MKSNKKYPLFDLGIHIVTGGYKKRAVIKKYRVNKDMKITYEFCIRGKYGFYPASPYVKKQLLRYKKEIRMEVLRKFLEDSTYEF